RAAKRSRATRRKCGGGGWSGRRDLNPRHRPWQPAPAATEKRKRSARLAAKNSVASDRILLPQDARIRGTSHEEPVAYRRSIRDSQVRGNGFTPWRARATRFARGTSADHGFAATEFERRARAAESRELSRKRGAVFHLSRRDRCSAARNIPRVYTLKGQSHLTNLRNGANHSPRFSMRTMRP